MLLQTQHPSPYLLYFHSQLHSFSIPTKQPKKMEKSQEALGLATTDTFAVSSQFLFSRRSAISSIIDFQFLADHHPYFNFLYPFCGFLPVFFSSSQCRDLPWADTWQTALTSQGTLILDMQHPFASIQTCSINQEHPVRIQQLMASCLVLFQDYTTHSKQDL